jgi:hypothetical protein
VPEGKENIELTGGGEIGGRDVVDAPASMIDAGVDYAIDQGIEGVGDLHTFVECLFTTMVLASRGQINHRLSSMGSSEELVRVEPGIETMDEVRKWSEARIEQMKTQQRMTGSLHPHDTDIVALYQLVGKLAERIKKLEDDGRRSTP